MRNAKLYSAIYQLQTSVQALLNSVPSNIRTIIGEPLIDLDRQGEQIIGPLFAKITKHLEQILLGIHKEDFGRYAYWLSNHFSNDLTSSSQAQPCSQYVKSLQHGIAHFQSTFLSKFPVGPSLTAHIRNLATRLLVFFVRHAALVRPLKEPGKLKLAADMAQLEFAVGTLIPVKELGQPYKALRALRPFIFRETTQLSEAPELDVLTPTTVLHHLFSRADPSLQSPHITKGWTLSKYSEWLDQHTEEEAWALIKSTLEIYTAQVNARGEKEFTPIYPVILFMGTHLLQKINKM